MFRNYQFLFLILSIVFLESYTHIQGQAESLPTIIWDDDGTLIFTHDGSGNRILDYSYAGYKAGAKAIPAVPIKVVVPLTEGDATPLIQAAIDYVSDLPINKEGFKGAILLNKGTYKLHSRIKIISSGVVLRGSGTGNKGTVLLASGNSREPLIGIGNNTNSTTDFTTTITDDYVPVNAMKVTLDGKHDLKIGETILIERLSNQKWIDELGMNSFGGETDWLNWRPNERNIIWERSISDIKGNVIFLDAPLTCAIEEKNGGGTVSRSHSTRKIKNIGIENMVCRSEYDISNSKDEQHCWDAIIINNAQDTWVRQISFENFAGSAVAVLEKARRVTIEDCISLNPISEIGGFRRYTFFTEGQQVLFQRCYSENGYHDFATGFCAAGPNAFVQCESKNSYSFSGSIDSWSCGTLFDIVNIHRNNLSFNNRGADYSGAGWCAANSVFWQCTASKIECYSPRSATNWSFGSWGQFAGNGQWIENNNHINPRSLYYSQLDDRISEDIINRSQLLPIKIMGSTSPTAEFAAELTQQSNKPPIQLKDWIDAAASRNPILLSHTAKTTDQIGYTISEENKVKASVEISDGWLRIRNRVVTGKRIGNRWWRGDPRRYEAESTGPHITRYVPGKFGPGYTDNLQDVAREMVENEIVAFEHNYGLWYDRRRDDHERIARSDGEVWAPFYELPFDRSGTGLAWDGLSKYDLTKPNLWYWQRLSDFAEQADQKGLLLIHQNYFQHNILEAGGHWADFPWRTANNINATEFPEPPPYAGDKRIFMAEQFYDISNPIRRELHRNYIRQCLSNFNDNSNVIQLISAEYTGPIHFVEFWLDVITQWENETGNNALVGLSATKDVQDAILTDSVRSKAIELIDIRYWHYRDDGSEYAPNGGENLAPRQHARLVKTGKTSFESVHRAISEYRTRYPNKAVIYSSRTGDEFPWAIFMAGGSMAPIPKIDYPEFYTSASTMIPDLKNSEIKFILENPKGEKIIYNKSSKPIPINLEKIKESYNLIWINPQNGTILKHEEIIRGGKMYFLNSPTEEDVILYLKIM